jgi:radical SAM protein with 4Fe4S-binding SPASM domain
MKTFLIQINVTRDCNLRCSHCYIHTDVKVASKRLERDEAVRIGKMIGEFLPGKSYQRAEIHFIGGEPTMLDAEWFKDVLPRFREAMGEDINADIVLVSNLLTNEEKLLEIASLFDVVNTSWEPQTRFITKANRFQPKLEALWEKNARMLMAKGIRIGVTTAITSPVVAMGAAGAIEYLEGVGFKNIHFGFFTPAGDGIVHEKLVMPTLAETADFLIDTGRWAIANRDRDASFYVNPFESMLSAISHGEPMEDIVCPIVSGSIDINWDGNSAPCLATGGNKEPNWSGNILTDGLIDVVAGEKYRNEVRRATIGHRNCMACEERPVCLSGCGLLKPYWDGESDDCHGFKRFIQFVRRSYEQGIIPRSNNFGAMSC